MLFVSVCWFFVLLVVCVLQGVSFGWCVMFKFLSFPVIGLSEVICVDAWTVASLFMLAVCSSFVLVYGFHYFGVGGEISSLFPLVVWFVGVMWTLMLSGCCLFSLVMWEYLGFVSFLLVLFYGSGSSVRAAVVTLVSSRFGDVGLFCLVCLSLSGVSWWGFVGMLSFLVVVLSKSASFPFVAWLLEAMRAPTPVSSLVHSSTLVAAGVWFMMRYGGWMLSNDILWWVFISCYVSVLVSGFSAVVFGDLKKIVALSTCNNICWCLLFYVFGDVFLCVCQLVTHGICKCLLFMFVGDLMSSSGSSQASVGVYSLVYSSFSMVSLLVVLVFGLCGMPFMGIFFSKHLFYSGVVGGVYNGLLGFFLLFGISLSYMYSMRLVLLLCGVRLGLVLGYASFFCLVVYMIFFGVLLNFVVCGSIYEVSLLGLGGSILFLLVQVFGVVGGVFCFFYGLSGLWESWLWGCDWLVDKFYGLFSVFVRVGFLGVWRWEYYVVTAVSSVTGGVGSYLSVFGVVVFGVVFLFLFISFIVL